MLQLPGFTKYVRELIKRKGVGRTYGQFFWSLQRRGASIHLTVLLWPHV